LGRPEGIGISARETDQSVDRTPAAEAGQAVAMPQPGGAFESFVSGPTAILTPDHVLALQRAAGNCLVSRMVQAAPPTAPDGKAHVARLIAEADGPGIVALVTRRTPDDVAALDATTPAQRAGMVRVLTDMTWTGREDEAATVELICWRGGEAAVARLLDATGYRQKVLDSVDDEALHKRIEPIFAPAVRGAASRPPEVERALAARDKVWHIRAVSTDAIRQASHEDRLRMLTVLLDMSSSGPGEEARMLDILQLSGSDLPALMADLRGLGYTQALFDHIDAPANQSRLVALLTPLRDAATKRDLEVFSRSAKANFVEAMGNAWDEVKQQFSSPEAWAALLRGIVRPIMHPLATIEDLWAQSVSVAQQPTLFGVVTLLRDLFGTLAVYLTVAGGVIGFVGGLLTGLGVSAPFGIPVLGIGLALLSGATFCGIVFASLAVFRMILDGIGAGAATTAHELDRQQRRLADDVPVVALVAVIEGLGRGAKLLKGSMGSPEGMKPEGLTEIRKGTDAAVADLQSQSQGMNAKAEAAKAQSGGSVGDVKPPPGTGGGGMVINVPPKPGRGAGGLEMQASPGGQVEVPQKFPGIERPPVTEPSRGPDMELPAERIPERHIEPGDGRPPVREPGPTPETIGDQGYPKPRPGDDVPGGFQDTATPPPTKDVATERGLLDPLRRPKGKRAPKPKPDAPPTPEPEKAPAKPKGKGKGKGKAKPKRGQIPGPPDARERQKAEQQDAAKRKNTEVERIREELARMRRDADALRRAYDKLRREENLLPDGEPDWDLLTPDELDAVTDADLDPETATLADLRAATARAKPQLEKKTEQLLRELEKLAELRRPLIDKLRAGLTQKIKDLVIKRDGLIDKVTRKPIVGTPDIDHLIPLARLPEIDGFLDMWPEDQKEGANLMENLAVSDLKVNRKRQEEYWSEYAGRSEHPPDVLERADDLEAKAREAIIKFIAAHPKR
jgi:hypothetical protein